MWPKPHDTANLVTFTEEFFNGKLYFLCIDLYVYLILLTAKEKINLMNIKLINIKLK